MIGISKDHRFFVDMSTQIPLAKPFIGHLEKSRVQSVLDSGQLSQGPWLEKFEKVFCQEMQTNHAVAVSSGTSALHLAIRLSGISSGDEVITTPYSFIASANCIQFEGATPVFADIEDETFGLDPKEVLSRISAKTKAVLAVHVYGRACNISALRDICKEHNLILIEDCCEALGAKHRDNLVGSFGDFATYGFYPNKHITTGEGGMLTFKDDKYLDRAKSLRNQGRLPDEPLFSFGELGYNYRLDELSAAMGSAQMEKWGEIFEKRKQLVAIYQERIRNIGEGFHAPVFDENEDSPFIFPILIDKNQRGALQKGLASSNIQSRPYFDPPIHLQSQYQKKFGYKKGDFPVCERVSQSLLALPFYTAMTGSEIDRVCDVVQQFTKKSK